MTLACEKVLQALPLGSQEVLGLKTLIQELIAKAGELEKATITHDENTIARLNEIAELVCVESPCLSGFTSVDDSNSEVVTVNKDDPDRKNIETILRKRGGHTAGSQYGRKLIINVPYDTYEMAIKGEYDSLPYGGFHNAPLVIRGLPGPNKQRPVLITPANVGCAVRIKSVNNVQLHGLDLRGTPNQGGVLVSFESDNVLVEDCVIQGFNMGFSVEGGDKRVGTFTALKNIVRNIRSGGLYHSQGIYCSALNNLILEDNVFFDCGSNTDKCQAMYLVNDARGYRKVVRNFIKHTENSGRGGIQARGGIYDVCDNVLDGCGVGLGVGHRMAEEHNIWTTGLFRRNLIMNAKFPHWLIALNRGFDAILEDNVAISPEGILYVIEGVSNSSLLQNGSKLQGMRVFNTRGKFNTEKVWNRAGVTDANANIQWSQTKEYTKPAPTIDYDKLLNRPMKTWDKSYSAGSVIDTL